MKMFRMLTVFGLMASLLCGCDSDVGKAAVEEECWPRPLVGEGSILAIGLTMPPEGPCRTLLDNMVERLVTAETRSHVSPKALLDKAGVNLADMRWALLTGRDIVTKDGKTWDLADAALAVALPHDFAKIVAAIPAGTGAVERLKVADVDAVRIPREQLPCVRGLACGPLVLASVGGKVLVCATTPDAAKRQVELYRDGKGKSAEFSGFALGDGQGVLRGMIPKAGKVIPDLTGPLPGSLDKFLPDAQDTIAGIGSVNLLVKTSDGKELDVELEAEMAKPEQAKSVAGLTGLFLLKTRAQYASRERDGKPVNPLVKRALNAIQVKASERKLTVRMPVSGERTAALSETLRKSTDAAKDFSPQIGKDSVVAVGLAVPTEGRLRKMVDKALDKLEKMSREKPSVKEARERLSETGIDLRKLRWALLTAKKICLEDGRLKSVPEMALVVSLPHDAEKLEALVPAGKADLVTPVQVAGCRALKVRTDGLPPRWAELGVSPVVVSIDGKLLVLASTPAEAERQVALYCAGEDASDEFPGFTVGKDDLLRIAVPKVGRTISEAMGPNLVLLDEALPDGAKLVSGIGLLQLAVCSPGGNAVDFCLEVNLSEAADAQTLSALLNGLLQPARAQYASGAKRGDPDSILVKELLDVLDITADGARFSVKLPIPAELADKGLSEIEERLCQ